MARMYTPAVAMSRPATHQVIQAGPKTKHKLHVRSSWNNTSGLLWMILVGSRTQPPARIAARHRRRCRFRSSKFTGEAQRTIAPAQYRIRTPAARSRRSYSASSVALLAVQGTRSRTSLRKAIPVPRRTVDRPSRSRPAATASSTADPTAIVYPAGPSSGLQDQTAVWAASPPEVSMAFNSRRASGFIRQSASRTSTTSGSSARTARSPNSRAYPFPSRSGSSRKRQTVPEASSAVRSVQLSATT